MAGRLRVIDYHDDSNRSLVQRFPGSGGSVAITMGDQLIVRENQEAVFYCDGKALDTFGPGRYTLSTQNIPFITRILTIPWDKSPFQGWVYFVGKQPFLNQKWGTRQPITVLDPEFGEVRLRANGSYGFRVVDSKLLLKVAGTQNSLTTDEITSQLKDFLVGKLMVVLGKSKIVMRELPAKFDDIKTATRAMVADEFSTLGIELTHFVINAITPPKKIEDAIDDAGVMRKFGNHQNFMAYHTAMSMEKMAESGGGGAGGAMGMGMGAGFGMMMPGMIQQSMMGGQQYPPQQHPPQMPPQGPPQPQNPGPAGPAGSAGAAGGGTAASGGDLGFDDLESVAPAAATPNDPRQMVRAVAQTNGWQFTEEGDRWEITVPTSTLRRQTVNVVFGGKDKENHEVIFYSSVCGPVSEKNAMALLRYNAKLVHGAFAIQKTESGEVIVVQSNQLADTADPLEVTRTISSVAWQADRVEEKLTGKDDN